MVNTRGKNDKKTNAHISKTRRQRGYNWEDTLVKRINASDGWSAMRLGSPSIGLPDVMAISTKYDSVYTIEAKSGTVNLLPVPADQIEKCKKIINVFDKYTNRKIVLAFKFLSKKRIGKSKYEWRPMREYYKIWKNDQTAYECVCTYDGRIYLRKNKKRVDITLEDCNVPFETRDVMTNLNM
ncbi:MAG: Holliday junction resolvase [Cenarchaeum symbiont of Oopsacas minuta]|nr:Holliday junction resolvase [Cenarchaeum symbiont of Oopsacas minuta]